MRNTAITIAFSLSLLSACDPQPADMVSRIGNAPSPAVGGMGDTLKSEAEQAVAGGNYARAAQTYKQLVDKEPENRDYTLAFADSLRRSGNHQAAVTFLDKYLASNPGDAVALETRGLCLMSLGSVADAGKSFEQVMALEPTRWRTLNAIGVLFTMKGKVTEALAYFDEALTHNPENASVQNNRGLALAMERRFDEAVDSFQRTRRNLRIGSTDMKQVDMNLALVYAIAGRLEDAERTASPYLSKAALYNNMAVYAQLANNPDLSRSYLDMALTQSPVYYERAWKNLGLVGGEASNTVTPQGVFLPAKAEKEIKAKATEARAKTREELKEAAAEVASASAAALAAASAEAVAPASVKQEQMLAPAANASEEEPIDGPGILKPPAVPKQ